MTFTEAFEVAVTTGPLIRRQGWLGNATVKAGDHDRLYCYPTANNWSGEYSPSLTDAQATDWVVSRGLG